MPSGRSSFGARDGRAPQGTNSPARLLNASVLSSRPQVLGLELSSCTLSSPTGTAGKALSQETDIPQERTNLTLSRRVAAVDEHLFELRRIEERLARADVPRLITAIEQIKADLSENLKVVNGVAEMFDEWNARLGEANSELARLVGSEPFIPPRQVQEMRMVTAASGLGCLASLLGRRGISAHCSPVALALGLHI